MAAQGTGGRRDLASGTAYHRASFALLTQHRKDTALGPVLSRVFEADLTVVGGFDTDTLGTFTREVPRPGSQLQTARRKAQLAVEMSGHQLGLGSEGAFGSGPFGLGSWNTEVVVLLDATRGIEIVGRASAVGHHHHGQVRTWSELEAFATRARFPDHGLVLRPDHADDPRVFKEAFGWEDLAAAFEHVRAGAQTGVVFVESDLRAHRNPTRMAVIAAAGEDLAARMGQSCPACSSPGFAVTRPVPGRLCAMCATPTREPVAHLWTCVACDHVLRRPVAGAAQRADPARCDVCNP